MTMIDKLDALARSKTTTVTRDDGDAIGWRIRSVGGDIVTVGISLSPSSLQPILTVTVGEYIYHKDPYPWGTNALLALLDKEAVDSHRTQLNRDRIDAKRVLE